MSFEGSAVEIETFLVLKRRYYAVKFAALFIFTLFQKIIQLK